MKPSLDRNDPPASRAQTLQRHEAYFSAEFSAMASPCQVLIETDQKAQAKSIAKLVRNEVFRIEQKYSRYIAGNTCHSINQSDGKAVAIDTESFHLLSFANTCYEVSDGLFDISSGILRKAWRFDCSDKIASQSDIDPLLKFVGWNKVSFDEHSVTLRPGMELDFGGIGKEYAASKASELCRMHYPGVSTLINLGGDIQISEKRKNAKPWLVGIENSSEQIPIIEGALATSGDAKRFLLKDGIRYSHILNPNTGWPIMNAAASVTVLAPLCIQAGMLATIAILQGTETRAFLEEQELKYWMTDSPPS